MRRASQGAFTMEDLSRNMIEQTKFVGQVERDFHEKAFQKRAIPSQYYDYLCSTELAGDTAAEFLSDSTSLNEREGMHLLNALLDDMRAISFPQMKVQMMSGVYFYSYLWKVKAKGVEVVM
jgi:hypothetical protein